MIFGGLIFAALSERAWYVPFPSAYSNTYSNSLQGKEFIQNKPNSRVSSKKSKTQGQGRLICFPFSLFSCYVWKMFTEYDYMTINLWGKYHSLSRNPNQLVLWIGWILSWFWGMKGKFINGQFSRNLGHPDPDPYVRGTDPDPTLFS